MQRRWWIIRFFLIVFLVLPTLGHAKKKTSGYSKMPHAYSKSSPAFDFNYDKIFGMGLMIGDPVGINGKYWLDHYRAVEVSLGANLGGTAMAAYGDYLFHMYPIEGAPELPLYAGGGLFLGGSQGSLWTGVRGVFGITYLFTSPFDVFMEVCPRFVFSPKAIIDMTLSVGVRIYFNLKQ